MTWLWFVKWRIFDSIDLTSIAFQFYHFKVCNQNLHSGQSTKWLDKPCIKWTSNNLLHLFFLHGNIQLEYLSFNCPASDLVGFCLRGHFALPMKDFNSLATQDVTWQLENPLYGWPRIFKIIYMLIFLSTFSLPSQWKVL